MTYNFSVTYEIVTTESAESGDYESAGYIAEAVGLREGIRLVNETESAQCEQIGIDASEYPICNPAWVTVYNSADYISGEAENRHLHFPANMTPASRRRVCRLLGIRV